MLMNVNLIQVF